MEYPFDAKGIIKKKKSYRKQLLADDSSKPIEKNCYTWRPDDREYQVDIRVVLLNYDIKLQFYEL